MRDFLEGVKLRLRWSLSGLFAAALMLSACGGGNNIGAFEALQENPMASPTLSFAVPTFVSGSAGTSFGIGSQSFIIHRFDIEESQIDLAVEELLAQALAAGFEVEIVDLPDATRTTYRSLSGTSPQLVFGAGFNDDGQATASVSLRR